MTEPLYTVWMLPSTKLGREYAQVLHALWPQGVEEINR